MRSGWYKESYRHGLAARGISTSRYYSRRNPATGKGPSSVPAGTKGRLSGRYPRAQRVEDLAKFLGTVEKGEVKRAEELRREIAEAKELDTDESMKTARKLSKELGEIQGVSKSSRISYEESGRLASKSQLLKESEMNLSDAEKDRLVKNRQDLIKSGLVDLLPKEVKGKLPRRSTITRYGHPRETLVGESREELISRASRQQEKALATLTAQGKVAPKRQMGLPLKLQKKIAERNRLKAESEAAKEKRELAESMVKMDFKGKKNEKTDSE